MTQKIWQDRLINRWAPIVGLSLYFLDLQRKQKLLLQMGSSNNSWGFRAQDGQLLEMFFWVASKGAETMHWEK